MTRRITMIVTLAAMLALPSAAGAATFDVDTTADPNSAGACTGAPDDCSIRQALAFATANADPEDTINVPAGTYTLALGELNSNQGSNTTTTIKGAGTRTTTIDAAGNSRVFDLQNGNLTLEDLTATNGSAPLSMMGDYPGDGGAILTRGTDLVLNRVAVTNSESALTGGAIAQPPENINSAKSVTLNASTISGNKVTGGVAEGLGGGVFVFGDLTATNSTISGNSVENTGLSMGGGLLAALDPSQTLDTTITLLNTTIAGNSVPATGMGGGFAVFAPPATMATTGVTATNTIIAGNTAMAGSNDCMPTTMTSSDHNLSSDTSCNFNDAGSKTGVDAQLGALADNGGPTDTRALAAASPAIDAGTNTGCPATDQRGTARPQGTNCDIGAFERVPDPPPAAKSADLAVSLKAKPKKPKPRGKIKYSVTVTNSGPDAAESTVLTGKVSKGVKKLKPGSGCKLGKGKKGKRAFTCDLGQLAAGGSTTVKLKGKLAKKAKSAKANVRVTTATADPTNGNDSAKIKSKVKKKKKR